MRSKPYNYIPGLYLIAALTFSLLGFSCTTEQGAAGDEKEVTIVLNTRSPYNATRAGQWDTENYMNTVEVLVFEPDGRYLYTALGKDITNPVSETAKKTFSVTLKTGTYDLVILANSREHIMNSFGGPITANTARDILYRDLVAQQTDKWNPVPGTAGFNYMPMWGIKKKITISNTPVSFQIEMIRLLAKIDIYVAGGVNFKLESAHIYNYNTAGRIIPDPDKWAVVNEIVSEPTVPLTAMLAEGPLNYTPASSEKSENEIYLFEAVKGTDNLSKNTCLVVGGRYDGELCYYRIDFEQGSSYLDIKRNFRYEVTVNSVSSPGFPDPDKAFRSQKYGMEYEVVPWEDEYESNYGFGGQYRLDLTQTYIETNSAGGSFIIGVSATHPDGWHYTLEYDSLLGDTQDWVTNLSPTGKQDPEPANLSFDIEQSLAAARRAYLHIHSGNLTNTITIYQH